MTNVVFTGKCDVYNRTRMLRPALTRMAGHAGFTVLGTVKPNVRYLVASRTDTRKAQAARDMGVEIITYQRFLDMCQSTHVNNENIVSPITRFNAPLPEYDAGRMASKKELAEKLPKGRRYRVNKVRKTAIGIGQMRRALDLGY